MGLFPVSLFFYLDWSTFHKNFEDKILIFNYVWSPLPPSPLLQFLKFLCYFPFKAR